VDETGTAQFYCWYPYRLHGKDPVTIARAEVVWADNYGNLFIGDVH
jgi:phage-related protein